MSTDAPRFDPEPSTFTPAADADLVADPETGTGPGGTPMAGHDDDADTPSGDPDANAPG
ncbi:MAG: hypothetical protein JWP95_562 [Actinotalea sp.]|nr:hypothetical protein [Actinotalea sp.]